MTEKIRKVKNNHGGSVNKDIMARLATAADVRSAYNLFLGRTPESSDIIKDIVKSKRSLRQLRLDFLAASEFKAHVGADALKDLWALGEIDDGFRLWVDLSDRYVSLPCLRNNFEPSETKLWKSIVKPGHAVVDVGANIGWYTMQAARLIGSTGRVSCFEPRPVTYAHLVRSIVENGMQHIVRSYNVALADREERGKIHWRPGDDNPGHTWLGSQDDTGQDVSSTDVCVQILDDIIDHRHVDVMKIDVEGAEWRVVSGGLQVIQRSMPMIMSEIFPEELKKQSGINASDFISKMLSLNYDCKFIDKDGFLNNITDVPSHNPEILSVLFVPKP
ncbi:FkbM family methyltransferase [Sphingobium limneticum]|uniref:FkbM family methyltransferase n=1 Tax=Sphingobium limneticum TaxID=1007511 RepID=A0ABQ6T6P6_9SPHN|nr:FkbM family methyltransferase [Sphingobium limneticum]KAA9011327.1 FkbM family methyltransferase [Sphingobium limneticum]